MKVWESPEFKEEQEFWYLLLKCRGFEDAEIRVENTMCLRQSANPIARTNLRGRTQVVSRRDYYILVSHFVEDTEFTNDVDRIVMTLHAQGKSLAEIKKALAMEGDQTCRHRHTIRYIIRRYLTKWKLRTFSPKQMNKKKPIT